MPLHPATGLPCTSMMKSIPPMFKISETHYAATWLLDPRAPKVEMPPELAQRISRMKADAEKIKEAE